MNEVIGLATRANQLSLNQLAASVLAQDRALKSKVTTLVDDMMNRALFDMKYGDEATKSKYASLMMPYLLKALQQSQDDQAAAEERVAYERMLKMLRGEEDTSDLAN